MATNAGQGISGIAGASAAEARAEGKATKKPKPPVRHLPPGPRSPYDFYDAISPPAIPKTTAQVYQGPRIRSPSPISPRTPRSYNSWWNRSIQKHVQEVLDGATIKLDFFGTKRPRVTGLSLIHI